MPKNKSMIREYDGDEDAFWNDMHADLKAMDRKKTTERLAWKAMSNEFILSPEDEKELRKYHSQKASTIEDIPARYQRRIRKSLNIKRKLHNKKAHEITKDEINPIHDSYNEKYTKLIVDFYNEAIIRKITEVRNEKVYAHELWKIKDATPKQLKRKMTKIPREVQAEIIKSLNRDPEQINSYKSEVKKQIIAIFNTYY